MDWPPVLGGGKRVGLAHLCVPARALLAGDSGRPRRETSPPPGWIHPGIRCSARPSRSLKATSCCSRGGCPCGPIRGWPTMAAGVVLLPGDGVHGAGDPSRQSRMPVRSRSSPSMRRWCCPPTGRSGSRSRSAARMSRVTGRSRCIRGRGGAEALWTRHASGLAAPARSRRCRLGDGLAVWPPHRAVPRRRRAFTRRWPNAATATGRLSAGCGPPGGAGTRFSPRSPCPRMWPLKQGDSGYIRPCSTPPCTRPGWPPPPGRTTVPGGSLWMPFTWAGSVTARGGSLGAAGQAQPGRRRRALAGRGRRQGRAGDIGGVADAAADLGGAAGHGSSRHAARCAVLRAVGTRPAPGDKALGPVRGHRG